MGQGRVRHILQKNESDQRPTRLLFVDIESKLSTIDDTRTAHQLWFGYCLFWRRRPEREKDTLLWQRFTTVTSFWDYVVSRTKDREPLYLIAHNVAYDFGVMDMFVKLQQRGFVLTSFYTSGHTSIIRWSDGKRKIIVLDNGNYFGGALASWGQALDYPKLEVDPLTAPESEVDPYCQRDVEIMYRLWLGLFAFLDEHNLGSFGVTLPSQAFRAYRHRFMSRLIVIHDDEDALALERAAYHGGRTSIFYQGTLLDGPYYKLDVNSMYPYVMATHPYPADLLHYVPQASLDELTDKLSHYAVIAHVEVQTDEPVYPIMARSHLLYPVGRFWTALSTPELEYAREHGHLCAVDALAYYRTAPLFQSYVEFFYTLKQQYGSEPGNPYYAFTKLYLNSLYGKFGQRSQSWEQVEEQALPDPRAEKIITFGGGPIRFLYRFGDTYWVREDGGESYHSAPSIAAHVTAYARMYLWELILAAGREHVYYTDTDSLIVDAVGLEHLTPYLSDDQLGALKIEQTAPHVTLNAPKCYQIGTEQKSKGVPRHATETAPNTWQFDAFPSFLSQSQWAPNTPYHTTRTQRRLTYAITDGTTGTDGWIRPFSAFDLPDQKRLSANNMAQVEALELQKTLLQDSLPVAPKVVFRLWDYRKGDFKRARDRHGNLVPQEYSGLDAQTTELGFSDLNSLQDAIRQTVQMQSEIHSIERKIRALQRGPSETVRALETEPLPF